VEGLGPGHVVEATPVAERVRNEDIQGLMIVVQGGDMSQAEATVIEDLGDIYNYVFKEDLQAFGVAGSH